MTRLCLREDDECRSLRLAADVDDDDDDDEDDFNKDKDVESISN